MQRRFAALRRGHSDVAVRGEDLVGVCELGLEAIKSAEESENDKRCWVLTRYHPGSCELTTKRRLGRDMILEFLCDDWGELTVLQQE